MAGIYPSSAPLAIGTGTWTGQNPFETFEGAIDEVALYSSALDTTTLQGHLDQLLIPEPGTVTLLSPLVLLGLLRRRR